MGAAVSARDPQEAMTALSAYIAARTVDDGGCLRWIGAAGNGHPSMRVDGRQVLARRVIVEMDSGPIARGKIVRCVCETPLCVARDHLIVTTYRAVAKDCGEKGLMSGLVRSARIAAAKRASKQAKLDAQAVIEIRASTATGAALARRYGVSISCVSRIRRGSVWREFAGNPWAGLGLPAMGRE